jgi:hypothetical protein
MEGRPYETDDEFWNLNRALEAASGDEDNIRAVLDMAMALRRPDDVLGDPALRERLSDQHPSAADEPDIGPDREQLLAAASG